MVRYLGVFLVLVCRTHSNFCNFIKELSILYGHFLKWQIACLDIRSNFFLIPQVNLECCITWSIGRELRSNLNMIKFFLVLVFFFHHYFKFWRPHYFVWEWAGKYLLILIQNSTFKDHLISLIEDLSFSWCNTVFLWFSWGADGSSSC